MANLEDLTPEAIERFDYYSRHFREHRVDDEPLDKLQQCLDTGSLERLGATALVSTEIPETVRERMRQYMDIGAMTVGAALILGEKTGISTNLINWNQTNTNPDEWGHTFTGSLAHKDAEPYIVIGDGVLIDNTKINVDVRSREALTEDAFVCINEYSILIDAFIRRRSCELDGTTAFVKISRAEVNDSTLIDSKVTGKSIIEKQSRVDKSTINDSTFTGTEAENCVLDRTTFYDATLTDVTGTLDGYSFTGVLSGVNIGVFNYTADRKVIRQFNVTPKS